MSDGKQAMAPKGVDATPPQAMPATPGDASTPTPSAEGNPELTVQDLGVLKTIIEVAQSRGAFKPNELEAIGKTYTKLDTFLASIQNQQVAAQGDAPVDPVPATSGE